jgi:putative hydrolase of the HAD superfamily
MTPLRAPKAVLFDLFHTLASVPPPASVGEIPISQILGVPAGEWHRLYYDDDVLGRCLGHICDDVEVMRRVTHAIDPTVDETRIFAAVESRRRRFQLGLVRIEQQILEAIDRLRAAGIRTALVSDAGTDDIDSWENSPLRTRFDVTVFSCKLGIRKPDPRIYKHALDAIGVSSSEAIFVGDGGSDEHRGARAVGMQAVLVTRLMKLYYPDKVDERRAHVDWEFEDVPAFVNALALKS